MEDEKKILVEEVATSEVEDIPEVEEVTEEKPKKKSTRKKKSE